jgi:hypothetical protein
VARKYRMQKPEPLSDKPEKPSSMGQIYRIIAWEPTMQETDRRGQLWALELLAARHRSHSAESPVDTLNRLPSDLPGLRPFLRRPPRAPSTCADGTWRNARCWIFRALRASGVAVRANQDRRALSDAWKTLTDQLSVYQRKSLIPFARWCDDDAIRPGDVSNGTFERYEQFLINHDPRDHPDHTFANLCRIWRDASRQVPDWPKCGPVRASRYDNYSLPWAKFAPSLLAEITDMNATAMNPDPLEPQTRRRIKPITAEHQTEQLRQLASAYVLQSGCDPRSIKSIADLVAPAAARAALTFLIGRAQVCHSKKNRKNLNS